MYFSSYYLEKLELKNTDLVNLSDKEQIQKICLQWMSLSSYAQNETEVETYTRAYHGLISPYDNTSTDIHNYYPLSHVEVHHAAFSFSQREQIELSYQALLVEFSNLETEVDKQTFATLHREFICLANALRVTRKDFEGFFAFYLQALYGKRLESLSGRIIYQWRLSMIRLFGIEGLDDFQYRNALATGQLMPILEKSKLYSPVKLLIAFVNSVIIVIQMSLDYILNWHSMLRFGFSLLSFHPIVMLLVQLPKISQILEMVACPNNQIIRPLCAYSKWSAPSVTALLSVAGLFIVYAVICTSLMTTLVSLLPYLKMMMMAYFLYSIAKLCVPFFRQSILEGMQFLITFGLIFALVTSIKMYLANTIDATIITLPKDQSKQWLTMLGLYSRLTVMTSMPEEPLAQIKSLPKACVVIPENVSEAIKTRYNKANLSSLFFNTPRDAETIRPTEVNPYSHCLNW